MDVDDGVTAGRLGTDPEEVKGFNVFDKAPSFAGVADCALGWKSRRKKSGIASGNSQSQAR